MARRGGADRKWRNAVSSRGSILRKVIPFLANREELCLLLNDLGHVALAQEF